MSAVFPACFPIRRRRANGLATIGSSERTDIRPIFGGMPDPFIHGERVLTGREIPGSPQDKTWHATQQQVGEGEPGIQHQGLLLGKRSRRLPHDPPLEVGVGLAGKACFSQQARQRQTRCSHRTDRAHHAKDLGRQGFVGLGSVMLARAPHQMGAEEAG